MSPLVILFCILGYFSVLLLVSYLVNRTSDHESFYLGNKSSPWYVVAFGMVGTSLSGVTFISVTGKVAAGQFGYLQTVIGFFIGYFAIAFVLLPLYYRLNLTSIYGYLGIRYGTKTQKTGSAFFILSRTLGASARLFLAGAVLYTLVFAPLGIPFWLTIVITLALIYLYTFQSGIKAIIWTDTIQSTTLILAIGVSLWAASNILGGNMAENLKKIHLMGLDTVVTKGYSIMFRDIIIGAFVCIGMTGLDQGMMQRNLSIDTIKSSQKNLIWFSVIMFTVNVLVLCLGAMLALYSTENGLSFESTDKIFGTIATQKFGAIASALFIFGLIAATFSSADDAMAALTTTFCIDIMGYNPEDKATVWKRKIVHFGFAVLMLLIIMIAFEGSKKAVIDLVLLIASYTYGPLLGLYAFGLFTKRNLADYKAPIVTILTPIIVLTLALSIGYYSLHDTLSVINFKAQSLPKLLSTGMGAEAIIYNAVLCFGGLWVCSEKHAENNQKS